ncbi:MAG TPA: S41 family peptidase [Chitinophagaceae bacterium]|nr:S41 family peptidase [Chitinophagaceae bacterium]
MRKLLFIIGIIISASYGYGQNLDKAAIHRIGDYGKVWSVVNLFHPEMAYNKINADSLFTENIKGLLKDPSAANFKKALQQMFAKPHDPYTVIVDTGSNITDSVQLPERSLLTWLPDSIALLHFDETFMSENNNGFGTNETSLHLRDTLKNARGVIIDLRKNKNNDEYSDFYEAKFVKALVGFIIDHDINYPSSRSRIHYGHESQTFDMSSFYYQGWVSVNPTVITKKPNSIHKPVCLLINRFNKNLSNAIAAVQMEGLVKVVAEDSLPGFEPASTYSIEVADGMKVNITTSEIIYDNGCKTFTPDAVVYSSGAHTEDSLLLASINLLKAGREIKMSCPQTSKNNFNQNKVEAYDSTTYPSAPLRLLGLMRYWSAINYFCPNKDRIVKNWDSVLYEYVPKILAAKDSMEYTLAVAKLITEIHDGHGWLGSKVWQKQYRNIPEIQLKYVQNKTIVYKTFNNSLKDVISTGDEILKVDDVSINGLRKQIGQYIGASNDAALQRSVTANVLAGPDSSSVKITYLHNGIIKTLDRKRTCGKYAYGDDTGLPGQGRPWTKLNNNTGYVDFGKIEVPQLDSMMNDFRNLKTIIIDNRSYPRGTVWTFINYLSDKAVTGAKGSTMIADSPDPNTTTIQYSVWEIPVTPKFIYNGRIIILVNETTQSQAEYSCMVIQAAHKNTTIIGSQTAGADGDVTGISIPGGIQTAFSGHGIHYPDGRPTQGIGIVPDVKISPTIKGIIEGKDEVLERAIQFAATGK